MVWELQCDLVVVGFAVPLHVGDHVQDAGVVADDVKVAVVDQGLVARVEDELNVVHLRLHEDVDHREVDITRVGERHLANVKSFPRIGKSSFIRNLNHQFETLSFCCLWS